MPSSRRIFVSSGSMLGRRAFVSMIEAEQMQHAVHRQMHGMIGKALAAAARLRRRHAIGERDVAEIAAFGRAGGKGQHIGRLVLAAKVTIEALQHAHRRRAEW